MRSGNLLAAGLLAAAGLLLTAASSEAEIFCRRGARSAGPRVVYVPVYGSAPRAGERYFYVPPAGDAAQAGTTAPPRAPAAGERYFYLPAVGSAVPPPPPRLWQPGDGDPGLTHTTE